MDNFNGDMKEYVEDFNIKGHCKIELTNTITGEVKTVEKDNAISIQHKAYLKMLSCMNLQPGAVEYFPKDTKSYIASGSDFFQHLIMTGNTNPMTEEDIYFDDSDIIGYASVSSQYSGSSPIIGSVNFHESQWDKKQVSFVFDFPTHAGNGTIGTVGFSRIDSATSKIKPLTPAEAQGITHNFYFLHSSALLGQNEVGYSYDYITNKFLVEIRDGSIFEIDLATMSYSKIGVDKVLPYGSSFSVPCINRKTYNIIGGKLVEYDLTAKTERVSSEAVTWSPRYPLFMRNDELYLFYNNYKSGANSIVLIKIDLKTLNPVETKEYIIKPNKGIESEYLSYSPVDDYVYTKIGNRIKFENLFQNKTVTDLSEFEDIPTMGIYGRMRIYKRSDGIYGLAENTDMSGDGYKRTDLIPSGFYYRPSYTNYYLFPLVKLTDYPANWATAMVLPEPIEKNQTQTMKVTYTFSYDDLWKTEGQN